MIIFERKMSIVGFGIDTYKSFIGYKIVLYPIFIFMTKLNKWVRNNKKCGKTANCRIIFVYKFHAIVFFFETQIFYVLKE